MNTEFDPYHKWLGIRPTEQPPTYYRLLGIDEFEPDPDVISHAADQRMLMVRSLQSGKNSALSQKILNEISAARVCLLDTDKKAAYDAQLRAKYDFPLAATAPIVAIQTDPVRSKRRSIPVVLLAVGSVAVVLGIFALAAVLIVMARSRLQVAQQNQRDAETSEPREQSRRMEDTDETPPAVAPPLALETPSSKDEPGQQETPAGAAPPEPAVTHDGNLLLPEPGTTDVLQPPTVDPVDEKPSPPRPEATTSTPPPEPHSTTIERRAVPAPEKLARAEALVEEIYAAKLSAAEDSPEKLTALSTDIQRQAEASDVEPHNRFALLRKSAAVAVLSGDLAQAWIVCDELEASFEIDAAPLKLAAAEEVAAAARPADETKAVAEQMLTLAEQAAEDDWAEAAIQLGDAAVKLARRARNIEFVKSVVARQKVVAEVAERYRSEVAPALATLKTTPDDPAANLAVGAYLALVKGEWEPALPLLAKGPEVSPLRIAAEQELDEDASRIAVGDKWYEIGQAEEDEAARVHVLAHAKGLYQPEVDTLSGLTRTRVEKRLADLASIESERSSTAQPAKGKFSRFAGTWIVVVGKGGKRYVIDAAGNVRHGQRMGKLNSTKDGVLLDFGDDQLERLRLDDSGMTVEHFQHASTFPNQAQIGKARRVEVPEKIGPAAFRPYSGKWTIKYTNGVTRRYTIAEDGTVLFSGESATARLRLQDGDVLADFGDGKLERLEMHGAQLWVEHYLPATEYPHTFMLYGVGERGQ